MLTLEEIITKLYREGFFSALLRTFKIHSDYEIDKELRKDLIQEIILILLEYKHKDKLVDMYYRNELGRFTLGIIKNQLLSTTSSFYSKYIKYYANKNTEEYMSIDKNKTSYEDI